MNVIDEFIEIIKASLADKTFVKITLSKPEMPAGELLNIYIRLTEIKNSPTLSFTYHNRTNDKIKNFLIEEGLQSLQSLIHNSFQHCTLFTITGDFVFRTSKEGTASIGKAKPSIITKPLLTHDRQKVKRTTNQDSYLIALGIMDANGVLIPKMADKFRQINKYLEIIEALIKTTTLPEQIRIVDMGSGKGYLTFALYDYLVNKKNLQVSIIGIEQRQDLVDYCNLTANTCGFINLKFENKSIQDFNEKKIDVVIALHACDTATDDAIAKAIFANASLIICAPCCHKQIRQQIKGREQDSALMKYGIFIERQLEMVTDTMRALIMEKKKYQTKIFEFVSNEHTRKNILLVGTKTLHHFDEQVIDAKLATLKNDYKFDYHYLEKIVTD